MVQLEFKPFKKGIDRAEYNFRYLYRVGQEIFTSSDEAFDQVLKERK